MQAEEEEHFERAAAALLGQQGPYLPPLDDEGWETSWDYVKTVCPIVVRSAYHTWPRAGGLEDQDEAFVRDMNRYSYKLAVKVQELTPAAQQTSEDDAVQPETVADWSEYG
jgi:hypothetical protein